MGTVVTVNGTSLSSNIDTQSPQIPVHVLHAAQPEHQNRPFFLLHGLWTGRVPFYARKLCEYFLDKQPFYTLGTYRYDGPEKLLTLKEMAAAYLQIIRAIQPEGPYWLSGFCNGALLAYEITRQLYEQGEKVDFLLMISPTGRLGERRIDIAIIRSLAKIFGWQPLTQLRLSLHSRHLLRHLYRLTHPATDLKLKDFSKLVELDARLNKPFPPIDALYKDFIGVFSWLLSSYKLSFTPENMKFIWAGEELWTREGWKQIDGDEHSVILPGHHIDWVRNCEQLVTQILAFYHEVCTQPS
jgi:hypothetical protein